MTEARPIIITGASSGIGLALARQCLKQGRKVHAIARNFARAEIPEDKNFIRHPQDLAQLDALDVLAKTLLKQIDTPFDLVHCAGYGRFGQLEQFNGQQMLQLITTNLISVMTLTRYLLPAMKQQQKGKIIIVGSESALKAGKQGSVYSASKFGLRGFALALRQECAARGVAVCQVHPGMVDTAFFDALDFRPAAQPGCALTAEDVAEVLWQVLQAPQHRVMDEIHLSPIRHKINFDSATSEC